MQSALITSLQKRDTHTENGMVSHSTSGSKCIDLFFNIGAMRTWSVINKLNAFVHAYDENPEWALKILFYSRDIRGGQGERKTFRDIINEVINKHPHLIKYIPEYGRWDDLLYIENTELAFNTIKDGLKKNNALCAKWMPRKGQLANTLRKYLNLTPKQYRKTLVNLSKVVETHMCAQQWDKIIYSHVPSIAAKTYRNAFKNHDKIRYTKYIEDISTGKEKVNANAIFPHDIVKAISYKEDKLLEEQWKALPNYLSGKNSILPICDVSGSMAGLPLDVCISLGLYISERNIGPFKDCFITFSSNPKLQVLKGSLYQRYRQLNNAEWQMSTNLEAVFNLLLTTAINNNISKKDMPETLLIMSDMQFNAATKGNKTAFGMIKKQYKEAGYKMPKIVFWNLKAVDKTLPVQDKDGVALVSGFSPSIMKNILAAKDFSPKGIMLDTIMSPRYSNITV